MNKMVKAGWIGAVILGVGLSGAPASWAAKIAQVDTAKVVQEYQKAKDSQIMLEKEFMANRAELKKLNDDLEKQQGDLTAKKGVVSQQEYDSLKSKFEADKNAFQEKYNEIKNSFVKKQQDSMESILNDIKAIAGQIAKTEKYDAVFDKDVILYGGEDITFKVLDQLNKKK